MAFCDRCGSKVEWHDTATGSRVALDPDPHSEGTYAFDRRAKVERAPQRSRAKMYRSHFETCPKKGEAPRRRSPFICSELGCERADRHLHCWKCKSADHLSSECDQ